MDKVPKTSVLETEDNILLARLRELYTIRESMTLADKIEYRDIVVRLESRGYLVSESPLCVRKITTK